MSLEVNFEISKDHFIASYTSHPYCSRLMLADQDVSFQLLLQCHALCHGLQPSETVSPQ